MEVRSNIHDLARDDLIKAFGSWLICLLKIEIKLSLASLSMIFLVSLLYMVVIDLYSLLNFCILINSSCSREVGQGRKLP